MSIKKRLIAVPAVSAGLLLVAPAPAAMATSFCPEGYDVCDSRSYGSQYEFSHTAQGEVAEEYESAMQSCGWDIGATFVPLPVPSASQTARTAEAAFTGESLIAAVDPTAACGEASRLSEEHNIETVVVPSESGNSDGIAGDD